MTYLTNLLNFNPNWWKIVPVFKLQYSTDIQYQSYCAISFFNPWILVFYPIKSRQWVNQHNQAGREGKISNEFNNLRRWTAKNYSDFLEEISHYRKNPRYDIHVSVLNSILTKLEIAQKEHPSIPQYFNDELEYTCNTLTILIFDFWNALWKNVLICHWKLVIDLT